MYKELLEKASAKASAAKAILGGDTPNVEEANKLLAEAEELRGRAKSLKAAEDLEAETGEAIKSIATPVNRPLTVTVDEADNALKARPFKSLGELLIAVKDAELGNVDKRLLPLRSKDALDEMAYSINGALGDDFVGGLTKARWSTKAISGLNETVGSQGGFLVGTDQNMSLLQRVYQIGDLMSRVDMTGLSAGSNGMTFNMVNETSRADGSRRGGILAYWAAEAGQKTTTKPAFRQLELKLHKVVGLVHATDELLQDAAALESWIMSNLPEELKFKVEDAIINGTGVGMPQGILACPALVSVTKEVNQAADTVVAENIMKMWSRMWAPSRRNAIWLINQDVEPQLMQLSLPIGTGGVPLYVPAGGLSAAPYATIFGRPVIASEYCDTVGDQGDILFIDPREYQMIEKGGVQSASSIHLRFDYDETVFRFVYRCDGRSKWNSALTPKNSANTLSPFIALDARA